MKKTYKLFTLFFAATLLVVSTSCEDEDKFRVPSFTNGGFVKFVTQPDFWEGLAVVDGTNIVRYHIGADPAEASFVANVEDPNENISNLEVFVEGVFDGAPEEPVAFSSTTTFPFDVSFSVADMATLYNVPIETFQTGDEFIFTTRITTDDGRVFISSVSLCEECPETALDPETGEPIGPGNWNGGTIDQIILQGGDTGDNFILPAVFYTVRILAPSS